MDLKSVILGFLEWKQLTGYELKGMFSEYDFLPWSGNNNQIYTTLVELEKQGLVEKQTIQQEKLPAQKRYSVTDEGRKELKKALMLPAEAPVATNDFLLHLAWSECLAKGELLLLLDGYQQQVETELAMCREKARRRENGNFRSERERFLWVMVFKNRAMSLQCELDWLVMLRNGLANK